jgi:uncharacterized protein
MLFIKFGGRHLMNYSFGQTRAYRSFGRFLLLMMLALVGIGWSQEIPPVPAEARYLSDYAMILSGRASEEISRIQEESFSRNHVPITVVIIQDMARYGWNGPIEPLAKGWFNAWGIGSPSDNRGMLLLISVNDHKARIELGASWGRHWDDYCAQIMRERIVPRFKAGDYDGGIINGVAALGGMAKLDPHSVPPNQNSISSSTIPSNRWVLSLSPWGTKWITLMALLGAGCLLLGIPISRYRKQLLIVGAVLLIGAALGWIVIICLFLMTIWKTQAYRGRGISGDAGGFDGEFSGSGNFGGGLSDSGSFSSGSSDSGSFSGGSSDGGGASGDW